MPSKKKTKARTNFDREFVLEIPEEGRGDYIINSKDRYKIPSGATHFRCKENIISFFIIFKDREVHREDIPVKKGVFVYIPLDKRYVSLPDYKKENTKARQNFYNYGECIFG